MEVVTDANSRPLNILICTPCLGDIKAGTAWCIARAMTFFMTLPYKGQKSIDWEICKSSNLAEQRTRLVSRALAREATHILWIDADNKFPVDTISRLLNHNLPVVAANYPTKEIHARPTAYAENDKYVGPVWTTEKDLELVEVSHCGMGVMLCDTRIFEALDLPFFAQTPLAPDFVKTETEDVFFCRKLREKGIRVFIDHGLSQHVAHVGDFEYTNAFACQAEQTKQTLYRDPDAVKAA